MAVLELKVPDALAFFLEEQARYKVAYGGRGAGRSWTAARALAAMGYERKMRFLCAREIQVSIADSVHKLISEQIEALGLSRAYDIQRQGIYCRNGTEFIFSGIRSNVNKIKSLEGVDIAWVEEAESISEESWRVLVPTIRKPGSEIWATFNPREETDPTYQRFVVKTPPNAIVRKVGWQDNPWFPDELRKERDWLLATDPDAEAHVYGGEPRNRSDAQVLRGRWRVEPFEPQAHWDGPYFGVDWGFAVDPSTMSRCWIDAAARTLYVEHEAYGIGVEIEKHPDLFDAVPGGRDHVSRADNARPEMINFMQRNGYSRMIAATKGPGSVEQGVEFLRSFAAIVIHPRCIHAAQEARLWIYKVDRLTGDVKPELEDKNNHVWDGIRYSLEPLITTMPGQGFLDFIQQEQRRQAEQAAQQQAEAEQEDARLRGRG